MPRIKPLDESRHVSAARAQSKDASKAEPTKPQKRPPRSLYILMAPDGTVCGTATSKRLAAIDQAEGEVIHGPYILAERKGND